MDEIQKLARIIYSMASKAKPKKKPDDELHQRTWTDEGIYKQLTKTRPRFEPIDPAQKEMWKRLVEK